MSITHTSNISAFLTETKYLIRLAAPLFIGQFCTSALGLVDTVMSAKVGNIDLAAISLGTTFWTPILLFCLGITLGLAPIVAHLNGSKKNEKIPGMVFNTIYPVTFFTILSMIFLIFAPSYFLQLTNCEPELIEKTQQYLYYIATAFPAIAIFNILKNAVEGLAITIPAMIIAIITIVLNIPLNYIFIYGKLGIEPMGAVGCGLATSIVTWISVILMLLYCKFSKKVCFYNFLLKWQPLKLETIKYLCIVGLPISIALIIETFSYAILGYAVTPFGSTTVAAHQIANIMCIITFMLPISMANAMAIKVSQHLGEGSKMRVVRSIKSCLALSLLVILPIAIIIFIKRADIINLFTQDPEVIKIVTPLFIFLLVYQLQDSFFGTTMGILRGFKDTKFLMIANFLILWVFCIPLGCVMGYTDILGQKYEIYGLWGAIVIGYYIMTIVFTLRSRILYKNIHKYMPNQIL